VLHEPGGDVLLPAGLTTLGAGDHLERQVSQSSVDQRASQRPQPRTGTFPIAGHAEDSFTQAPQRIGTKPMQSSHSETEP
jgi:hypothetical protein